MMEVFVASVILPCSREASFDYLCRPANFLKMLPADAAGSLDVKLPPVMERGGIMEFNVKAWGTNTHIVHEIVDVTLLERIAVKQIKGPFRAWFHEQAFTDAPGGKTLLTNTIHFEPPGGMLGFIVTKNVIHSNLKQWVHHGQDLLRQSLEESVA